MTLFEAQTRDYEQGYRDAYKDFCNGYRRDMDIAELSKPYKAGYVDSYEQCEMELNMEIG